MEPRSVRKSIAGKANVQNIVHPSTKLWNFVGVNPFYLMESRKTGQV